MTSSGAPLVTFTTSASNQAPICRSRASTSSCTRYSPRVVGSAGGSSSGSVSDMGASSGSSAVTGAAAAAGAGGGGSWRTSSCTMSLSPRL
ncbi:hypothetical protein GDO78_003090 [Eleutherodactylus coqui]|uniref:Uncharacterized protein n=1 Tax=Eleutherodactylus coqui TaxID=57060 RepID=A0A8J6EWI1_ELECQ|nr:hypothetical protein GDO78_003090 [Eleutherodactylus coqui]